MAIPNFDDQVGAQPVLRPFCLCPPLLPSFSVSIITLPLQATTCQSLGFKMPLDINYEEICSKFDRLVASGIIYYQPNHPVAITDNGMIVRSHHYLDLSIPPPNVNQVLLSCSRCPKEQATGR